MAHTEIASYVILIFLAILWIMPFYAVIISALKTNSEFSSTSFWQLPSAPLASLAANLKLGWVDTSMQSYFINSLLYGVVGSVSATFLASLAAFPIARLRFRGNNLIFFVLMAAGFFPFQMYILPLLSTWISLRLFDTMIGTMIVYTAIATPFVIFLLRNYLVTIPSEIQDAAIIDGASYLRIYTKIFLPLSLPAIVVGITFQFVWIWNDLFFGLLLTQSLTTRPIMTGLSLLVGGFIGYYASLSAVCLVAALPPLIVFLVLQKYVVGGILLGAVKG
jgi:multiple sugar transport system permease protein